MPNTVIDIAGDERGVRLTIAVPVPELRLALPPDLAQEADLGARSSYQALRSYFDAHLSIVSNAGARQAHVIESIVLTRSTDPDVGPYEELSLQAWVAANATFDPRLFTLEYDAVMHQVPNHSAVVQITPGATPPVALALITFDFSIEGTRPVDVRLASGQTVTGSPMLWALGGVLVVVAFGVARRRLLFGGRRSPTANAVHT